MIRKDSIRRIELSAIYLTAALLTVSMFGLTGNVRGANQTENFPNLYADGQTAFVAPEEKTVYFTFDDGPSENTAEILDVLKRQDVKATFFVTGQNADEAYAGETLRRILDEGHSLGLHSYSHNFEKIYRWPDAYLEDLDKLNNWIMDCTGERPDILRFPGGSATINASPETMVELIGELTRRGYLYYDWDVVSGDDGATAIPAQELCETIVTGVRKLDRAVVLLHDSPTPVTSAAAVDQAIDILRAEGYSFDRLTRDVEPVHILTERFKLD